MAALSIKIDGEHDDKKTQIGRIGSALMLLMQKTQNGEKANPDLRYKRCVCNL